MKDILNALTGTDQEGANVLAINIFYSGLAVISFVIAALV